MHLSAAHGTHVPRTNSLTSLEKKLASMVSPLNAEELKMWFLLLNNNAPDGIHYTIWSFWCTTKEHKMLDVFLASL